MTATASSARDTEDCTPVTSCRGCGRTGLEPIIALGPTPLANDLPLLGDARPLPTFALDLVRCPACTLVQLGQIVSPERLFSDYLYFSSFSDALVAHADELVDELMHVEHLHDKSLAIEIASNDGYLLQHFIKRNVPVLGVEPARNIAKVANDKGIRTISEFFGSELGQRLASQGQQADVLIGNNVLAHVPDLDGFAAGVRAVLKPTGVAQFEFPYLKNMLDEVEFDTIYHEHQCYFSATALQHVFAQNDLELVDAQRVAIHGGSLRLSVAPTGQRRPSSRMLELLEEERAWGVREHRPYDVFAAAIRNLKQELVGLLDDLTGKGARIAAYGAAAKGVTLASYCGVDARYIDFVVDRSTYKQGRLFPVGGMPILPPEELLARKPEYALMFTWNFANEILRQQSEYTRVGGRFIVPVPSPRVLNSR